MRLVIQCQIRCSGLGVVKCVEAEECGQLIKTWFRGDDPLCQAKKGTSMLIIHSRYSWETYTKKEPHDSVKEYLSRS